MESSESWRHRLGGACAGRHRWIFAFNRKGYTPEFPCRAPRRLGWAGFASPAAPGRKGSGAPSAPAGAGLPQGPQHFLRRAQAMVLGLFEESQAAQFGVGEMEAAKGL